MPPPLLIDLANIDASKVVLTHQQIYELLPHRHEFALLTAVCHIDEERKQIVSYYDVKPDAWWVKGHVPGRPILPGVLMLEMAAQTAAVLAKYSGGFEGFIAYGGVTDCRFREPAIPPARLFILSSDRETRPRRIVSDTQGIIDGRLIFEAQVTGMPMR